MGANRARARKITIRVAEDADGFEGDWPNGLSEGDLGSHWAFRFWQYVARMDEHRLLALKSGLVEELVVPYVDLPGPYPEYPTPWADEDDLSWERFYRSIGH